MPSVAVVDPKSGKVGRRIPAGSHPGALLLDAAGARLFVASANADTVSVIDTRAEKEIVRIPAGLHPGTVGNSTQALALSADESTLFVADAQSQAVAVIRLGDDARIRAAGDDDDEKEKREGGEDEDDRSRVVGFIPTARYPSALAVVGQHLFVGNGKGEGSAARECPERGVPAE